MHLNGNKLYKYYRTKLSKNKVPKSNIFLFINTFNRLKEVREKFYDLLVNCIPSDIIVKYLLQYLLEKVEDDLKY